MGGATTSLSPQPPKIKRVMSTSMRGKSVFEKMDAKYIIKAY